MLQSLETIGHTHTRKRIPPKHLCSDVSADIIGEEIWSGKLFAHILRMARIDYDYRVILNNISVIPFVCI